MASANDPRAVLPDALQLDWNIDWNPSNDINPGQLPDDSDDGAELFFLLVGMGSGFILIMILSLLMLLTKIVIAHRNHLLLTNTIPGSLDDAALEEEQDKRASNELNPTQQELYFQAKDFIKLNPPIKNDLTLSQALTIQAKGVWAWEFKPHIENIDNIRVTNKTEVEFLQDNQELSIQTNFPVPKQNDVYYFETKLYSIPQGQEGTSTESSILSTSDIVSIGFASYPYPFFRLPGTQKYSIAYDSTGTRRYNQPFPLSTPEGFCVFPKLEKGDVIGCGIRTHTRTVFWTRNGKKLSESSIGGHARLLPKKLRFYPTLGSTGKCKLQVNLGQMGYVFIEANVKKWGFGPLQGNDIPPPMYKKYNKDVLLDSSDFDPNDLNLRNGDFPPDFVENVPSSQFMDNLNTDDDNDEDDITLRTMQEDVQGLFKHHNENQSSKTVPPVHPPSYFNVVEQEQEEAVKATNDVIRNEQHQNAVDSNNSSDSI